MRRPESQGGLEIAFTKQGDILVIGRYKFGVSVPTSDIRGLVVVINRVGSMLTWGYKCKHSCFQLQINLQLNEVGPVGTGTENRN